uniref:dTDP-D-glucose 4,6-dehydratase n=1 Tax=Plectus sambesii TaxID=2011161 RepID=A0A914W4T7_9BILA
MVGKEAYSPQNVLVTGGCGFIGSNFVNFIFNAWPNVKLVNLDKLILNSDACYVEKNIRDSDRYKLITGDIRNCSLVEKLLQDHQIDTIIHFAADCTSTRCYQNPVEALENNTVGFIEFLEAVRTYGGVQRFVHISTDEVYGDSSLAQDEQGKTENTMLSPQNPYAATKACCEAFVHSYRASYNLPIIILRINNIYGPNQWNVKVVPRFIQVAREQGKFTVQGTGEQLRSWLFVDDASEGIRRVAERGVLGEMYNLGTGFELNVLNVGRAIQKEVDQQLGRPEREAEFISIPDRPYNDLRYLIDSSKIERELGWKPVIPFDEGLRRVVASELREKKEEQRMNVLIYGGGGWIGQQFKALLKEKNIRFQLAECRIGKQPDAQVLEELISLAPTHVVSCTGRTHGGNFKTIEYLEGGADKANENVRDNLYCVIYLAEYCKKLGIHFAYIGTGYIFKYDEEHPVGGAGFKEGDIPNYFGNSYSVVKGFTDRMMTHFGEFEILNARITLPLNFELNEDRNLLAKIIQYPKIFDIPLSITVLPDCLPILVDLMEKRVGGNLNLMNPGPLSLHDILQLYKQCVDPNLKDYERIGVESEVGQRLKETKAHCTVDTTYVQTLSPILSSVDSLKAGFEKIRLSKNI